MLLTVLSILLVVLLAFYIARQLKGKDVAEAPVYRQRSGLFSPAERSFFGVLNQAVGPDYKVFGKVRVGDVLAPEEGLSTSERLRALNKINRMHFDFVVCAADDLSILCAIELDDKSHQQMRRQQRDEFLAAICQSAGLALISFPAQHAYSVPEVAEKIAQLSSIKPGRTGSAGTGGHVIATHYASTLADEQPPTQPSSAPSSAPLCPRCSSVMVKRTVKAGAKTGHEFWGCSKFPACREIRPL